MSTKYLIQENGRIAYDDQAHGPLVICVPSMGDVRGEYRFLIPQLISAGYRVVSMDVRGMGESTTSWSDFSIVGVGKDILAVIRELKAGPAIVVGSGSGPGRLFLRAVVLVAAAAGAALPGVHRRRRRGRAGCRPG